MTEAREQALAFDLRALPDAFYQDHARFSSDKRVEFAPKFGDSGPAVRGRRARFRTLVSLPVAF